MNEQRHSNGSAARARGSTLVITNLTKIAGVVIGVLEWAQKGPAQDSVLLFAAVLVIGAEAAERMILTAIRSVLGRDEV